ncbi:Hypothetical predicted protein [Pelobates cultripes]|uniref:Uncharacterized protein n=1 Tax=Pelobates cultripes TaxID=61616 RepID=A0AAD1SBB4_PELCU|nr:Hypothetical predicted protein [Pelobates cultripes]
MAVGNATDMANMQSTQTPWKAPLQSLEAILNHFWDTLMKRQQVARTMTPAPPTLRERTRGWREVEGIPSGTTSPQLLTHTQPSPPGRQAKGQKAHKHRPHWRGNKPRKRQEKTSSPITPTRGGNPDQSGSRVCGKKMLATKPAWSWRDTPTDTRTAAGSRNPDTHTA